MKRGEIWTVAGGGDYTGKPRPAVIVQDDRFDATDSIVICAITSDPAEASFVRVALEPSETNGLVASSHIMVDKIVAVRRSRLGRVVGRVSDADLAELNRALIVFLGLASRSGLAPGAPHD